MKNITSFVLVICFASFGLQAQFNFFPNLCQNSAGTYTDLGTSGSSITTANFDNANSAAQSIGFSFKFNGTNYSHFILNTNGFVKLGTSGTMTAPSSTSLAYTYFNQNNYGGVLNSGNAADNNILAVFNHDLTSSPTAQTEYRVNTSGTSGKRVCTIQFKNVSDKNILDSSNNPLPHIQFNAMNFQIKLYESNGMIEYIYGNFTPTSDTSLFKLAGCGIKSNTLNMITVFKGSASDYNVAAFQTGNYPIATPTMGFNFGNNSVNSIPTGTNRPLPDAGRTLRFIPRQTNDASAELIYSRHAQNIPWGMPHTIVARLTNVGSAGMTGIKVYLKVRGANNYLDSTFYNSLGAGLSSTVNFTGYQPENIGIDTISIELSHDSNDFNNIYEQMQIVSNHEIGLGDSSGIGTNLGFGTGSGVMCVKYHVTGKRRISKVRALIGLSTTAVGGTVYAVVINSAGNIVGQSQQYIVTNADLGKYHEFDIYGAPFGGNLKPAPLFINQDYYVGLAQPGGAATGQFFLGLQIETPNRTGAYFIHSIANSPTFTDLTATTIPQIYRMPVNARMDGVSLKLEPITSLNDPSCALSNQTIEVTVTNLDSIAIDFAKDTMHLEISSTGAQTQSFSTLINSGILEPDSSANFTITNAFDLSIAGQYNIIIEARQWLEVDTANNYRYLQVNVVDTPDVTLKVSPDSVFCFGSPFQFDAIPYTAGSTMFQWYVNGLAQGSPTANSSFTPSLVWGDTVHVDLITDHCTTGTFTIPSNEIIMKINPKPRLINAITGIDTVIEFKNKNYAIGMTAGNSYLWKVKGGTITSDSTINAVSVKWDGPNLNASISVIETNNKNCSYESVLQVHVISIVGIHAQSNVGIGDAYPNPADHTVHIPVSSSKGEHINLSLYDITGKLVKGIFDGNVSGNKTFSFSVNDLHEGLYFYKIRTSNGYEKVNRLSVKH